jgi:hypothetical protein
MIQAESVSECLGDLAEAVQTIAAAGSSQHHHANSETNPSHSDHDSRDCHHNGDACHSAHLGHCAFTIEKALLIPVVDEVYFRSSSQISANIFNLQANLFRPPIG